MARKSTSGGKLIAGINAAKIKSKEPPRPRTKRAPKKDRFDTPEKAYGEAERIIAEAQSSKAKTLEIRLPELRILPPSISSLTDLRSLSLNGTKVADIAPIAALGRLQLLALNFTRVANLVPLAAVTGLRTLSLVKTPVADLVPISGLRGLRWLWLNGTKVTDISPITHLTRLQMLSLRDTQVEDLSPLARLVTLQTLYLDDTPVADLTPLADLPSLQTLSVDDTAVGDLAPLSRLTSLCDGLNGVNALSLEGTGLSFLGTAAAMKQPLKTISRLSNPDRTIKTINHLRKQQHLPEYVQTSRLKSPQDSPEVPTAQVAAVEPVWRNDHLTLPAGKMLADLEKPDLDAALHALKRMLTRLANDAHGARKDGTGNAIAERAVKYLERLAADIPTTAPKQHELFELAHELEVLRAYGKSVNEEWPELLAGRYHSLTLAFDDTVRQFPKWREFKRNAAKDRLTAEDIAEAPLLAKEVAKELRAEDATPFIDPEVPDAVEQIAAPLAPDAPSRSPIEVGQAELAEDVLESVNNILKQAYQKALATWDHLKPTRVAARKHINDAHTQFDKRLGSGGKKSGDGIFNWARRVAKTTAVGGLAWLGSAIGWRHCFPQSSDGWMRY